MNNYKELCERYPFLIPRNVWTDKIPDDYDYSYVKGIYELPKGWVKLFLQMCEDIREPLIEADYLDKFRFTQIKEKYNSMRCYCNAAPDKVHEITDNYDYVSSFVCQSCGKPATKETYGWITSYCDDCCPKNCKYEEIKFNPIKKVTCFSKDGNKTIETDVSDIWDRLYKGE